MSSIRVYALLAVSVIASYWRILTTFFGVDDFSYVRLSVFPWPGWVQAFALRYFADYVVFAWHRNLVGLNPEWFHVTLLCIHLLNTWLVLTLLPKLGVRRRPDAMIAAFVFGLHPTTYTVTNWTALGFEELTVVMFTLVVLHLFAAFLERPRAWLLIAAPVVMFIGCGFKNLSILLPIWLTAAAISIIFNRNEAPATTRGQHGQHGQSGPRGSRGLLVKRAAVFILPTLFVTAWYSVVVTPRLPQFNSPAYEVDLAPASLARGFSVMLANLMNPLPVGRIEAGYQDSVPTALAAWTPEARVALGVAIVAIVLIAWAITCWRTRRLVFGAAMLMVMVVGLGPYAILPRHWLDYASWPLPACAALWGMTIGEAYRFVRERSPRVVGLLSERRVTGAALLVAYAWVNGTTLHSSNRFVRQASHAELVDAVARRAPAHSRILFVPPSELAYTDTVYGQSIIAMRPEKRLRVEYAKATEATESTEVTSEAAASDDVVLLALDAIADENGETPRLYEVDRARWAASGAMRIARGRTLIQPFSTGAGRVREIHLLLDTFSDRCALQVDVVRPSSTGFPVRVAGGVMRCRGGTVMAYRSVVLDQPLAPHSDYALHVNATANDPLPGAIRYGPLAAAVGDGDGASDAWAPFRIDGEPASPPCALAIRLVTKRLE